MGGDCLNYGCVPSKALIKTAKLAHQMRHGARLRPGGLRRSRVDFAQVMAACTRGRAIEPHDSVERYTGLGVDVLQGHARIVRPLDVEITGEDGRCRR
jgi:pyruvate/2-oxoglutarate dehydrogenase complex dihydrolipoamide dehydrogenase (E3) component